jgi:hypothetical protein
MTFGSMQQKSTLAVLRLFKVDMLSMSSQCHLGNIHGQK